jgi:hypothetical protein
LGKKFYNSLKIGPNFFSPLSFVAVFGSGMGKNQDPGSGINIPDPHCQKYGSGFWRPFNYGSFGSRTLAKESNTDYGELTGPLSRSLIVCSAGMLFEIYLLG